MHRTRRAAEIQKLSLVINRNEEIDNLRVYKCGSCACYHVGHVLARARA